MTPAPPPPQRATLAAQTRAPEPALLPGLLAQAERAPGQQALRAQLGPTLIAHARSSGRGWMHPVQALLQAFALDSEEGIALMGLAESLLRVPDPATRDALIHEHLAASAWQAHGRSGWAQAAALGLRLTARLLAPSQGSTAQPSLSQRLTQATVRRAMEAAMRLLGTQFVTGQTIAAALKRSQTGQARRFRYSFDMLGEAAMTHDDALRYHTAYAQAIAALARGDMSLPITQRPGISIKLSALHPRFETLQRARVLNELYPRVLALAQQAAAAHIGLNLDAEESERLELTLELFERLCLEPTLRQWSGLGTVVQAYQKRAPVLIDHVIDLTRQRGTPVLVRLVKGAYWDSEIKRAQLDGLADYPVYTRKAYTDVAYMACAQRLLAAGPLIYPQFATHNALTVADILSLAGLEAPADRYEFQCLHGMGEGLYQHVVQPRAQGGLGRPCRIYAPVGSHATLLAYLVRRLLENGANTSFVHQLADPNVATAHLLTDPADQVRQWARSEAIVGASHPHIPLPGQLYGPQRAHARGLDLHDQATLQRIDHALAQVRAQVWQAEPTEASPPSNQARTRWPVCNPAQPDTVIGWLHEASPADVAAALTRAQHAQPAWAACSPARRAQILRAAAARLEADPAPLIALLIVEAGKTRAAAVGEVREAVDFLRYYALQIEHDLEGTQARALGPVACISPWNFPLAIFIGQVAAALAAGNTVLAKPAEQTPLIAAVAVAHLHAAGIPPAVLQCLPGRGETVGAALVAAHAVQAVVFTGSCAVARHIQATLAQRLDARGQPVTLIAETGGLNAMVVDSSALPEHVVRDVITSAFDSAGQRCSALRVLCLQDEIADTVLTLLRGAMAELQPGDPSAESTDIGPVIDAAARQRIERHLTAMRQAGWRVWQPPPGPATAGHTVPPTLIEIDRPETLQDEIFGPVLHVVRYQRQALATTLAALRRNGYGLTFGVQSRLHTTLAQALAGSDAGNLYVNRSMIGAVVGVQPFGGTGRSGTGPKAGGPLYLLRMLAQSPADSAQRRVQACGPLHDARNSPPHRLLKALRAQTEDPGVALAALRAFINWAHSTQRHELANLAQALGAASPCTDWRVLPGPTGQWDGYAVGPRSGILGLASDDHDRLIQLAAVLAMGGQLTYPAAARSCYAQLPAAVQARMHELAEADISDAPLAVVIQHGTAAAHQALAQRLAARDGPIVGLIALAPGDTAVPLDRLVVERSLSINTAATGGNPTLATLTDPERA